MDRDPILGRFDLGAFTLWPGGKPVVSDRAHGTEGFHEVLLRHHDVAVRPPQRPEWGPGRDFLDWHGREVFKGQPGTGAMTGAPNRATPHSPFAPRSIAFRLRPRAGAGECRQ
jgi:hypothetical protein